MNWVLFMFGCGVGRDGGGREGGLVYFVLSGTEKLLNGEGRVGSLGGTWEGTVERIAIRSRNEETGPRTDENIRKLLNTLQLSR